MAEQIGILHDIEDNGWARVVTDRQGACTGCQSGSNACRSCLTSATLESRVINPIGAGVGDVVKITLPAKYLFKGAAIIYLLPIAALLVGAFGGFWLGAELGWHDTAGSVAGALGGLTIGFWSVVRLGSNPRLGQQMTPTISAIVTGSNGPAKLGHASCCG